MKNQSNIPVFLGDFGHLVDCLVEEMDSHEVRELFEVLTLLDSLPKRTQHTVVFSYLYANRDAWTNADWLN